MQRPLAYLRDRLSVDAPVTGRWDRLRVDQVVTNLLSNAIKYGPGKPVDVRVPGEGSTFTVELHRELRDEAPAPPDDRAGPAPQV